MASRVPSAFLLLSLGATLPGQAVAGVVLGFDGKPATGVVVSALAENGHRLREVLTVAAGRFALPADAPIHALRVQNDGVAIDVPVPKTGRDALEITFVDVPHFTLRGQLVDPGGAFRAGVDLVCRDAYGRAIVTTTTDAGGAFVIRTNQPVQDVLVDPFGWHHVEDGPFAQDRGLAIDLRLARDRFFCLRGKAVDEAGVANAGLRIQATCDGKRVAWTTTAKDGTFAVWATSPVTHLTAIDGYPRMERVGPWNADVRVDLDEREHGFVFVSGRLLEADGKAARGFEVRGVAAAARPDTEGYAGGTTGRRGEFCVRVARHQKFLWFRCQVPGRGAMGVREGFAEIVAGEPMVVQLGR